MEAVWRLLGLLYLVTIWPIVMTVGGLAALVWMVIDVVLQLVTGGSGLSGGSGIMAWPRRLYEYGYDQAVWVLFGSGDFPVVP